eukprot:5428361-Pleurochrysis_carterae.AAC.1
MTLAGLYSAKAAARDDNVYMRLVQQIGKVEYRIDRLLRNKGLRTASLVSAAPGNSIADGLR